MTSEEHAQEWAAAEGRAGEEHEAAQRDGLRVTKRTIVIVQAPKGGQLPPLNVWLADEYELGGEIVGLGDRRLSMARMAVSEGLNFDAHLNEQGYADPKTTDSTLEEYHEACGEEAAANIELVDAKQAVKDAEARKAAAGYWKGEQS